jgi:hypothetical protein
MQLNADGTILPKRPPRSNAERQRDFRRRNPGYYGRLKARHRAKVKALGMQLKGIETILKAYQTMPLMLPAPVEQFEIPGITIPLRREEWHEAAFVEVQRKAA